MTRGTRMWVGAVAVLLLAGCAGQAVGPGTTAPKGTASPPTAHDLGLPVPHTVLPVLSGGRGARDVSLPWQARGRPGGGGPFTVTVDVAPCTRLDGVHFDVDGRAVGVAVLGVKGPGSGGCTAQRLVAVTRVPWPSALPARATVTHAPLGG